MLDDTWRDYILIRVIVAVLHYIGPSCTAYAATLALRTSLTSQWPAFTPFQCWCTAEAAFFLFFLWYRVHLQREAVHPPLRSDDDRKRLFDKVRSEIHDPSKFLSGWFKGASLGDIGREDLKVFLNWAFWEGRADDEHAMKLEEYVQKVEKMIGWQFKPGHGGAKSLRLTIDPIEIGWRSLLWYTVILVADTVCHIMMRRNSFEYHGTRLTSLNIFPPRPAAVLDSKRSAAQSISYWLRPHTSRTRLPIVWIPGIGVGMISALDFLHGLDRELNSSGNKDEQVGILAIEILQVSSRLTHSILRRDEFLKQVTQILDAHGFARFVLASHSYGSVLTTHILTHDALASRVSGTLLVDPVSILLHMPDVAYNFTVRKPTHANEWQLWYFASKDPGVAYTLGRHFFWSENVLWRDRIMALTQSGMRITVSLASRDLIVDTPAVRRYLMEHDVPDPVVVRDKTNREHMELRTHIPHQEKKFECWEHGPWRGRGLEVLWWEDFDHGEIFEDKETKKDLIHVLTEYIRGE